jgi:general secretion pathway protein C
MALNIFSSLNSRKSRPPFEAAYAYIFSLMVGYFIADLAILGVRPGMLPTKAPPARPPKGYRMHIPDVSQYSSIARRNIFNSDKKIPPALSSGEQAPGDEAAPVLSQLPLTLEGTLVSSNPKRSVATINLKSRNETSAFMVDDDLKGMARITAIERRKVVFRNLSNHRLEYIEIPKDSALTFGRKETAGAEGEVKKSGEFEFTMNRSDLNKYITNLGAVLNQARMVPNIIPGTGGKVEGFRFVSIQPDSIYTKLGFKPMDVIKAVNGEQVNSPTKAMELYNALRSESSISLVVERNGRDENFSFKIPE